MDSQEGMDSREDLEDKEVMVGKVDMEDRQEELADGVDTKAELADTEELADGVDKETSALKLDKDRSQQTLMHIKI